MSKFLKISEKQYFTDDMDKLINYADIKLPRRATTGSAGYDIYSPCDFTIAQGETFKFPTGIRIKLDPGYFLAIVPRSGIGFSSNIRLSNSYGVIDSDYFYSDNEGHIWVKLFFPKCENVVEAITIKKGNAVCQGIILPYAITEDDDADGIRNGGFGSTSKV